jgi:hypothetical protein
LNDLFPGIGSNFYDLTPTPEFLNVLEVTANPSKMLHLMMNDENYGALFNEKDPMDELSAPANSNPRSISPANFDDQDELDITPLPSEDIDMPLPNNQQQSVTKAEE